jgi:hypothetical protein
VTHTHTNKTSLKCHFQQNSKTVADRLNFDKSLQFELELLQVCELGPEANRITSRTLFQKRPTGRLDSLDSFFILVVLTWDDPELGE